MLVSKVGSDETIWRCLGRTCGRSKESITASSFFGGSRSKVPLTTHIQALYQFSLGLKQVEAKDALHGLMSKKAIGTWFNYYRDLFSQDLIANPTRLGGARHVVQIDESYFSGKRKYNRGRVLGGVVDPWIFGLIDSTSKEVALYTVQDRTAGTLIPLIEETVLPGSTIVSDGWGAYNAIGASPNNYTHLVVNHSENFVDPITQAHTQMIEGFWAHAKQKYKESRGWAAHVRPSYIDEIMWRWNNKDTPVFSRLLQILANEHDPNQRYANLPPAFLARKPNVIYP